jgi:uncharacterized membrane protein
VPHRDSLYYWVNIFINNKKDILYSNLLLIVLIFCTFIPRLSNTLFRSIIGVAVFCFIPGYLFLILFLPERSFIPLEKDAHKKLETIVLSVSLSISFTILFSLLLNYIYVVSLSSLTLSVSGVVASTSMILLIRRSDHSRFRSLLTAIQEDRHNDGDQSSSDINWNSLALYVLILATLISLAAVPAPPYEPESYTEFYVLSADTETEATVPETPIVANQSEQIQLVITTSNSRSVSTKYRLRAMVQQEGGTNRSQPAIVEPQQTVQRFILQPTAQSHTNYTVIAPESPGNWYITFELYTGQGSLQDRQPDQTLRVRLRVTSTTQLSNQS